MENTLRLLTKRAGLFNEAKCISDRLAKIKNHVRAINWMLKVLGYTGDLDAAVPRHRAIYG